VRFGCKRWRIEQIEALLVEEEKKHAASNY
jgi:hypothetical protein